LNCRVPNKMSSLTKSGVFKRAWDAMSDFVMRKEVVGFDKKGNKYFRWYERVNGEKVERREVKWNTIYIMYDPNEIPSEWRMWLRKLRDTPPTEDELAKNEAKAEALRSKVAALEEADRLRRQRMQSMGMHAQQAAQQPDMSRFLQQLGGSGQAAGGAQAGGAGSAGSSPEAPLKNPGQGLGGSYKPDTWQPAGQQQAQEPTGSGDSFKPGTWQPGK